LPWHLLDEGPGGALLTLEAGRAQDPRTGWSARGLRVGGGLPRGSGWLFLAFPLWSVDTGGLRAVSRWPELVSPGEEAWPGESAGAGAGNPELGLLAPTRLPLLGPAGCALAASLPFGRDALYPFASSGLTLRAQLRRRFGAPRGSGFALAAGGAVALNSANGRLAAAAQAGGPGGVAELTVARPGGRALTLSLSHERGGGAQITLLGLVATLPAGRGRSVALAATRSLGPAHDRPYETRLALAWRGRGRPADSESVAK
jgi:hypothetical protein